MQDTVEKELASQANSSLIEWIKQYCKNDSNSGFCEPRNHIIVAVVRGEERNFVNIVVDSYEKVCLLFTKEHDRRKTTWWERETSPGYYMMFYHEQKIYLPLKTLCRC